MKYLNLMIITLLTANYVFGQTTFDRRASISSNSYKMVFESNRDGNPPELYLANIDGSGLIRFTNNSAIDGSPQWSPDGKSIIHYSLEDQSSGDIYLVDIETMNNKRITTYSGLHLAPVWSLDGKKIYYTSRRETDELRVFDLAKQTDELVMKNIEHHNAISFSPDGSEFLAVRVFEKNWDLIIVDTETKLVRKRFENSARENNPIWSSDGQTIFFASNRNELWHIYSMDVTGENIKNLTEEFGHSRFFTLSPSGESIFFTLVELGVNDVMYKMNINGSDKTKINFKE